MSVEQIVTCDKCGCVIRTDRVVITIATGRLRHQHCNGVDLCGECCKAFEGWLAAGPETPPPRPG